MPKNCLHIFLILCFCFCNSISSFGQTDTLLYIPEIQIEGNKLRSADVGSSILTWDSATLESRSYLSISEFLRYESNVFVKSYGSNSVANLSLRGASASQTLVLWNGLPIQSSMLGQLDYGLLPTSFSEEVSLQLGGNSSSWGSGAIGGVLSMNNQADFNNHYGISYSSSIGSFSNLNQQVQLKLGTKHFQSVSRFIYQSAKNDLVFRADPSLPKKRQEHAAFRQPAFLQSFYYQFNNKNTFSFHAWLQNAYKEIPPTTTQKSSESIQKDQISRFVGDWKHNTSKQNAQVKMAVFKEKQNFQDVQNLISTDNIFTTVIADLNYERKIKKRHTLNIANTHNYTTASSQSYVNLESQYRLAFLIAYRFELVKLAFQFSVRQEIVDKKGLAPVPFFGGEWKIAKNILLKMKVSRDFRLPTLNDLYWTPGGNPDLKAEQGWSQELGLNYTKKINFHQFKFSQTIYNRNIKDWILWKPSENSFFWEPTNVAQVWSWGTESSVDYSFTKENFSFNYHFNFAYTSSTYRVDLELPKIAKGDQLLYTPKFQANNSLKFRMKSWSASYQHLFVGKTNGANEDLPAYNIGNILLSYHFVTYKTKGDLFFALNNIYNKSYAIIERRPMPGINYQIGIHINFNK